MFEHIILGAIQGITEWVPISSKACVIAAKVKLFGSTESLNELINYALLLHLGTLGAALVYFWKDITAIISAAIKPPANDSGARNVLVFLVTTTVLTALGQLLINAMDTLAHSAPKAKVAIMALISAMMIVAGILQVNAKTSGTRELKDITFLDGIILGLAQACATLPGLSRAGTTMALLSSRQFNQENTLKLSFLMSMPVIFLGNIVKNHKAILTGGPQWIGVLSAFVVGIIAINAVMAFAKKVNFGTFLICIGSVLAIGILTGALD